MRSVLESPIEAGTKVFVRCDIDVPIQNGVIGETFRLDSLLETLNFIIQKGGIPIIAGHIGKPKGAIDQDLSTKQLIPYFNGKLGEGNYKILENLRFDSGEEQNDLNFAKELASKADIYVNESFATCHRKHASIVGITTFLPSYAGIRLMKEVEFLNKILNNPVRPLVLIVGGAKLESKLPVIEKFQDKADFILLSSLLSSNWSKEITHNMILSDNIDQNTKDINKKTCEKFKEIIKEAKTVLWAGPLGMYEDEEFIVGTREIAIEVSNATRKRGVFSVVGGGDTIAALNKLDLLNNFSFVSTGGSAMLRYLADGTLPGLEALN